MIWILEYLFMPLYPYQQGGRGHRQGGRCHRHQGHPSISIGLGSLAMRSTISCVPPSLDPPFLNSNKLGGLSSS
jgi:hypothetical protein